jgi:ribosomal protein L37AE/L43A
MEKERELKEKEKRRCKKCGSLLTYFRIRDKVHVCRSCGFIDKGEKGDKE